MTFGVDDEKAFSSTRDELLGRFAETLTQDDSCLFDVQLALDWKWGYGDGDLGTWQLRELEEFLLAWCPRKVSMPPAEAASIPASVSVFLSFLDEQGLLTEGSTPLHRLQVYLAGVGGRVVEAMGDRSRFGMGKSLLAGMAEVGPLPSPTDPAALEEMMDRFNALPFEVRGEILGFGRPFRSPWEQMTDGIELASAAPVPAEELSTLAEAAPILDRIRRIRDFVGEGRKLTAKGNLTVADAKALAAILGDPSLESSVEHGFSIRSAADLHQLQFMLRWARAAGAVRVARGKVSATATWAKLDAVAALSRAVRVALDKGPVALETADNQWAPRALIEVIDEGAPHLLAVLWATPSGTNFEELLAAVEEVCDHLLTYSDRVSPESRQRQVRVEVDHLFDVLALAGVVARVGEEAVTGDFGIVRRTGGVLSLTTLGRAVLAPYLNERGYHVPAVGELVERPLLALFELIGSWPPDRVRAEFDYWVQRHSAAEAAGQMATLLQRYTDPQWPVAAVDLAGRLPAPDDEGAVRRILDTPARGHAIHWLLDRGAADVPSDPDATMRAGIEMMASHARGDSDVEFLDLITAIDDIEGFIQDAWRVPVPEAVVVLEGIGRVHPDKAVAKSARKAVFRHRSLVANLTH